MNATLSSSIPSMLDIIRVDDVDPVVVGKGCRRRDLPGPEDLRVWVVDMAPGSVCPVVDEHDTGEAVYAVAGEVVEDDRRFAMAPTFTSGPESVTGRAPRRAHGCLGPMRCFQAECAPASQPEPRAGRHEDGFHFLPHKAEAGGVSC